MQRCKPDEVHVDESLDGELDELLTAGIDAGYFPGAGVIAARHGKVFYERYWGRVARRDGRLETFGDEHVFPLYSFSKPIATTAICAAHQRGLFAWDDPVADFLRGYDSRGKEGTTIRHLLCHAAAIPAAIPANLGPKGRGWDEQARRMCDEDSMWPPGQASAYHGFSGHYLAAWIVTQLTGSDFETWVRETVIEPIGAATLTLEPPSLDDVAVIPPPSEPYASGVEAFFSQTLAYQPAGGFWGRLGDMLRVVQLHLDKGSDVVAWSSLEQMHVRQFEDQLRADASAPFQSWGLGWMLGPVHEDQRSQWFGQGRQVCDDTFSHAGISTTLGLGDPSRDVAVAFVTTNGPFGAEGDRGQAAARYRAAVADAVLGACRSADAQHRTSDPSC